MKKKFVITIARGFGTGGKEIGSILAKNFGIECYENRILELASQLSGIEKSKFEEIDEKLRSYNLLEMIKKLPSTVGSNAVLNNFISDNLLYEYQSEIIRRLAENESCVIIGKCADYVLKDYNNVLKVYIEAPRDYTVKRIMRLKDVSETTAHQLIEKTDKYRAEYYESYTKGNYWTNPVNYDITLNSSTLGIEGCVDIIKYCLNIKLGC